MPDSEQEAIDRSVIAMREGDRNAYRTIVETLLTRVRGFVAARSLPGVDVDDIVQKTFVEAYTNIGDYEPGTDFSAWLITIARYQLLGETTRLRRLADYHRRYVPVALADASERELRTPSEEPDSRLRFLRECLKQLPDATRTILERRYETGASIMEIAETLGRSAGAVRKQLCLLRKQLHDCVTGRLAREGDS